MTRDKWVKIGGEEELFGDADMDEAPVGLSRHDPEVIDLIRNFDYMLGNPGEELVYEDATADTLPPAGDMVALEEDVFVDVDRIVEAVGAAPPQGQGEDLDRMFDIAALLDDSSAGIDLDRLYDNMRLHDYQNAADLDFATSLLPPFTKPSAADAAVPAEEGDLALAAMPDYLLRALLPADES